MTVGKTVVLQVLRLTERLGKIMKYYFFVSDNEITGSGEFPCEDCDYLNIEVSKEVYDNYCDDKCKYAYSQGKIIPNPNYETDRKKYISSQRYYEILVELNDLDSKRVRAICENEVKDSQTGQTWLDYYNSKAKSLREEMAELQLNIA